MAPTRKTIPDPSSSKTNKQQRRFSQRVNMTTSETNKSVAPPLQKKQVSSKRQQKKYQKTVDEFNDTDKSTSKENLKSMSIDSNKVDSDGENLSNCICGTNTDDAVGPNKSSSSVQCHIDDDDDDSNEFRAMFMSNEYISKNRQNYSSTPLIRSSQRTSFDVRTTAERGSSRETNQQIRPPLSSITVDHQSTISNINIPNLNTPMNPRIGAGASQLTQTSIGNNSLSSINYTTNNSALLETFAEYRTLRRDLKRALQMNATWKSDYQALSRQMEKLKNNSFPRPSADGRAFLEQLLESLRSSEPVVDIRTSKEIASEIGIPELTLLSCSNVDPQKTALRVFNHIFPTHQDKGVLINVANLNVNYPNLLEDILVWSKRCTPGCNYTMSMLKDALGNAIRCSRYKLKKERAILAAAAAAGEVVPVHDDVENMVQDDIGF